MPRNLTAADRRSLIRLAGTLPVGSDERKAILKGLHPLSRTASEARWFQGVHRRNKGLFYRGARGTGPNDGSGLGAMGKGVYLTWSRPMAEFFAQRSGGEVYTYEVPSNLRLLDAQSKEMAEIKADFGFKPWEYTDDPVYARIITEAVKALGYDGVVSDNQADGLVVFNPRKVKLIEEDSGEVRFPFDTPDRGIKTSHWSDPAMSRTLTASDRSALIRLASTLPAGSPERKAILSGLKRAASSWRNLERRLSRAFGWEASQPGEYTIFLSEPDEEGGAEDGEYVLVGARDLRGSGDMIEVYDYADRSELVPKKLIQRALKTRKLDFD